MKTKLLFGLLLSPFLMTAQTTYNLNWAIGSNGPAMNITVDVGDTVVWTWADGAPHTVESTTGATETFSSAAMTGVGMTYSHTFTSEGVNSYQCAFHPGSMFGTITVTNVPNTYNLNWFIGAAGPPWNLTISQGDTVIWTWTDSAPHTVETVAGQSVETFNSGTLSGMGTTFSHTFTTVGVNNYRCGIHPGAMFGTITVTQLSTKDRQKVDFSLGANPVVDMLELRLPSNVVGKLFVSDMLGKQLDTKSFDGNIARYDVSKLASGIYFVTVETELGRSSKKFVKQ